MITIQSKLFHFFSKHGLMSVAALQTVARLSALTRLALTYTGSEEETSLWLCDTVACLRKGSLRDLTVCLTQVLEGGASGCMW